MIRGFHHVGIHASDLERLQSFYEQAFGFEPVGEPLFLGDYPEAATIMGVEDASVRVLMMKTQNCFIELFEWEAPEANPAHPLRPQHFGYTHFMVDVTDIDEEYQRLSKLGMTFVHSEPVHFFGDCASIYGHDPDGNLIEIGQIPEGNDMYLSVQA